MPTTATPNPIQQVFSPDVSATYERVNHALTLGFDILWRRRSARIAAAGGGTDWADLCTGTGETAAYLSRLAPPGIRIHGIDFSEPMLAEARNKPEAEHIQFAVGDVTALPFPDKSLDLITISFATRNLNLSRDALIKTFAEFHRVLRPGGRFVNLETSQPRSALLRKLFHFYIRCAVRAIGGRMSGATSAYAYLAHTIPRFYSASDLDAVLKQAGFASVTHTRLLLGIAAIHVAQK